MLTWRLWRALRHPDEDHPLFQRLQRQPIALPGRRFLGQFKRLSWLATFLFSALRVIIPAVLVMVIAASFTTTSDFPFLLLIPLVLIVIANLYGALVAFNVMSTIKRERQQGTYDLLALTPTGLGASNWLIAVAWTRHLNVIERLATIRTLISVLLVLLTFILFQNELFTPVLALALMLALNLDALQTVISGCLSGMLAQQFGENGSPFIALALFAFVQIILVYLPVTLVAITLFFALHRALEAAWLADLILSVVVLALLFGLREIILRLTWRELERRLL